jgi:hypothetical protein
MAPALICIGRRSNRDRERRSNNDGERMKRRRGKRDAHVRGKERKKENINFSLTSRTPFILGMRYW